MISKTKITPLSVINTEDNTYVITTETNIDNLSDSIHSTGLINPPILTEEESGFSVVSGFRRIAACQRLDWDDIEARILDNNLSKIECAKIAIIENAYQRPLNLVEVSRSVNLLSHFIEDEESLVTLASELGLSISASVVNKIQAIYHLPWPIQRGIISNKISLAMASDLGQFDDHIGIAFATLFSDLNIGLNKQREILTWIKEISLRESVSIQKMLSENALQDILKNRDIDRTRKLHQLRTYLRQRRFPAITRTEEEFKTHVKALKMREGTKLIPPKNFEGTVYTLMLSFTDIAELQKRKTTLEKMLQHPTLKTILERKD